MNIVKITLAITVFTCFTSSCFGNDTHYNDLHKSDNSVTLHLIDLSACPAIIDILDDVLSEKDSIKRDNARYYLINLSPQGKGINAYITEHTHENLPNVGDFIGYALWGKHNDLIVIEGNNEYSAKFDKKNQTMTFNLGDFPLIYDPQTWEYHIYQNIYARYIWSIGWIWHIPQGLELKSKNSNIITLPQRQKK